MSSSGGPNLLTGPRLVEMAIVALISSFISGVIVSWSSVVVLQNEVQTLRASQDDLKRDIESLRRDLYVPRGWDPGWDPPSPDSGSAPVPEPLDNLVVELKASLHSAADYFHGIAADEEAEPPVEGDPDADFKRHLRVAEAVLARHQGRVLVGELELIAGQAEYSEIPEDLVDVRLPIWGTQKHLDPWSPDYPGRLPRLRLRETAAGRVLAVVPPPTLEQIRVLGSTFSYYYTAGFSTGGDFEITEEQRSLLLLRAQAEAMRELAMQNMVRPVETRTSLSMPRNMTPRALYEAFLAEFHRRIGSEVAA